MINFQMMVHTIGKSPNETIRDYINIRYERWLDYARFKCSKARIEGKEYEVLCEVLFSLLKRDENYLLKLYNAKKTQKRKKLTELDFFVLRAIDLNVNSPTSPYQYQNRPIPANSNVRLERLNIIDETDTDEDIPARILKEMRLMSWVLKGLDLTESERSVFEHKFLHGNSLADDWNGPESRSERYRTYKNIESTIHHVLFFYGMTRVVPKGQLSNRSSELADLFVKTHKIHKQRT